MGWITPVVLALLLPPAPLPAPAADRQLTFDERVAAQEAIERVYYAHQVGATLSFEQAVPRGLMERKVRSYLKLSVALERHAATPLTGPMLQRELDRMAASTRMPDRLRELFAALGDDPVVIQECLVRPLLVERLVRNHLRRGGGGNGRDRAWAELIDGIDPGEARTAASSAATLPLPATGGCVSDDTWANRSLGGPTVIPREEHTAVWTGSLVLIWGGWGTLSGERYDPATDTWSPISTVGAPERRVRNITVWTGTRMIVWGGRSGNTGAKLASGGRYDPQTDSWTATSLSGAPLPREGHVAVWTGSRMLVWGGTGTGGGYLTTGSRYDPATDTWSQMSSSGAPSPRDNATAVWAAGRMVVWGGHFSQPLDTGGRYDPVADIWQPTSTAAAPSARWTHSAVSTGSTMIVWGGTDAGGGGPGVVLSTGARYDPITDLWDPTRNTGAPEARQDHTAVWTGSEMIVWGGLAGQRLSTGARYDPLANRWTPTNDAGAPSARPNHAAVWADSEMIIWAGGVSSGGRYDPSTDTWLPTLVDQVPASRSGHTAVWTGNEMIVWGGNESNAGYAGSVASTGARYDPALDTWRSTSWTDAPAARERHTAVWTGNEMVVWGGTNGTAYIDSGGRYDPIADSWSPTSVNQAPLGRAYHSAIWTGTMMVIWGGTLGNAGLDTGGRYDPVADEWQPTRRTQAPDNRFRHTAVWTGTEMLVWGGENASGVLATGGSYDPSADSWSSMSNAGAPPASRDHTAVWTGTRMIVWGQGFSGQFGPGTGGRYDPDSDTWSPTSVQGSPSRRDNHTAIWTGLEMVIWGGVNNTYHNDGARYDPAIDHWVPTSQVGAPAPRSSHTAAWTGDTMIVWGGLGTSYAGTGGLYGLSLIPDADGDGYRVLCGGECDDTNPAIYAGAPQVCADGFNNDCDHPSWPSLAGTNESDDDGDALSECQGDCDDARAGVGPGQPQTCGDHVNNDCLDPSWPAVPVDDRDSDGDSFAPCDGDCNDTRATTFPGAPQACDGVNNDCLDPLWPAVPPGERDADGDTFRVCMGDCDDANANVRPGWPQICGDSLNNDCLDPSWPTPPAEDLDSDGDGAEPCSGDCAEGDPTVYPGAPQLCGDGLNNSCSSITWPTLVGTNEWDDDTDAYTECDGDCDDAQPGAWGRPSEALDIFFMQDKVTLTWSGPLTVGGDPVCYRVYRSFSPTDFVSLGYCLEEHDCFDSILVDVETPVLEGEVFTYLVRAQTNCPGTSGFGPWGSGSSGTPIRVNDCY